MTRNWERCKEQGLKAVDRGREFVQEGNDIQAAAQTVIGTLYLIGSILCQQLDAIEEAINESGRDAHGRWRTGRR